MNTYKFRNPKFHIVDRNPEFIEFLKTNPSQTEARHYRNILMRLQEQRVEWEKKGSNKESVTIDLFDLPVAPRLTLVSQ